MGPGQKFLTRAGLGQFFVGQVGFGSAIYDFGLGFGKFPETDLKFPLPRENLKFVILQRKSSQRIPVEHCGNCQPESPEVEFWMVQSYEGRIKDKNSWNLTNPHVILTPANAMLAELRVFFR